jgi:hypothetical protein
MRDIRSGTTRAHAHWHARATDVRHQAGWPAGGDKVASRPAAAVGVGRGRTARKRIGGQTHSRKGQTWCPAVVGHSAGWLWLETSSFCRAGGRQRRRVRVLDHWRRHAPAIQATLVQWIGRTTVKARISNGPSNFRRLIN